MNDDDFVTFLMNEKTNRYDFCRWRERMEVDNTYAEGAV